MINETNTQTVNLKELIDKVNNLDVVDNDIRNDIIASLETLHDYLSLQSENRLIKTNFPVGSIVYMCSVETVTRGINATDENPEGEEENLPIVIQKPFIPGTMYFEMLNNAAGQFVFDNLLDAIKFVNDRMGIGHCKLYNFPTIEYDDAGNEVIYDNGTDLINLYATFDKRIEETFKNVVHVEVNGEDFLGINYTPVENSNECTDDECSKCECNCTDDCPHEVSPYDEDSCTANCDGNCEECNG